MLEPSVIKTMI